MHTRTSGQRLVPVRASFFEPLYLQNYRVTVVTLCSMISAGRQIYPKQMVGGNTSEEYIIEDVVLTCYKDDNPTCERSH